MKIMEEIEEIKLDDCMRIAHNLFFTMKSSGWSSYDMNIVGILIGLGSGTLSRITGEEATEEQLTQMINASRGTVN